MNIKFIDLDSQYQKISENIQKRLSNVFECKRFIMGPYIGELEESLKKYTGSKYCLTCASGTDALQIPLMALGIGYGDAVITTPFTFMATAEVISLVGAVPIFVDVDETYNIDINSLEKAIIAVEKQDETIHPLPIQAVKNKLKLKAIIAVDLFGRMPDYNKINTVAKKHNLKVIEDAAQSFGSREHGFVSCNCTDVSSTSFFPAKPLGCYGDGGAIFTNDENLYDIMKSIRIHGQGINKYENVRIGLNSRMDTIQAAVLLEKLNIFDEELRERNRVAVRYNNNLRKEESLILPEIPNICAWAQYSILYDKRDELVDLLKEAGIPINIYYPRPLHLQKAFSYLCYTKGDFPFSEQLSNTIFSIPMNPYLTNEKIDFISKTIIDKCNML